MNGQNVSNPMEVVTADSLAAMCKDLARRSLEAYRKGDVGEEAALACSVADARATLGTILKDLQLARPERTHRITLPVATPVGYEAGVPQF